MKKFRIPQEVQVEDRIFGPITMHRLIILTIGGGITYMLYIGTQNSGFGVWFPLVFVFGSLTLALAFLEPFGMRFHKFLARAIEFFTLPRLRLWDKRYSQDMLFLYIRYTSQQWKKLKSQKVPEIEVYNLKKSQKEKVSDLLTVLSSDLVDFSDESIQKYRNAHKKNMKNKNK
ncbi:TPA: PrgI family protein [Candidatus Peregrinibacteria bacterium]|nr:PrgI family protein [Candidatus Peregrinibacteria bacterium]HIQ57056.1 PrgI family protein [Candidatus Gracilibacteria bacterium]